MTAELEIEQKIADSLFKRYGRVLCDGYVDGVSVGLAFVREVKGGKQNNLWSRRDLRGKLQVRVGKSSSWTTGEPSVGYRQKSDGTYNYDKIADKLVDMADYVSRILDKRAREKLKTKTSNELIHRVNEKYGVIRSGIEVDDQGILRFSMSRLTEEQAEQFADLANKLGLL